MGSIPLDLIALVALYVLNLEGGVLPPPPNLDWALVPPASAPLLIFVLRATAITFATLRELTVVRGGRLSAWSFGFVQSLLFVLAISGVLVYLENPLNLVAYATGFATGNFLGITLEARAAPGHSLVRIISSRRGNVVLEKLHRLGHGATEIAGHGGAGTVSVILCYVPRREIESTRKRISTWDPSAFIAVEHVRQLRGGWKA
jgi:uncharacterized protein YebE (UPF0316 family)